MCNQVSHHPESTSISGRLVKRAVPCQKLILFVTSVKRIEFHLQKLQMRSRTFGRRLGDSLGARPLGRRMLVARLISKPKPWDRGVINPISISSKLFFINPTSLEDFNQYCADIHLMLYIHRASFVKK